MRACRRSVRRLAADTVPFSTGRAGVFGSGDVRIGAATVVEAIAEGRRAAYAVDAYLKGMDLDAIRTRQTLAEPQPEFLSIVPFTERGKGAPLPTDGDASRGAQPATSSTSCRTRPRRRGRIDALPTVHMRGDRLCDLRRLGIEYGTTLKTLEPQFHQGAGYRASPRTASPARQAGLQVTPRAFIAASRRHRLRAHACTSTPKEVIELPARLHADQLATRHDAIGKPRRHPVRVLRPLRQDVPYRGADAQAHHARGKYEVDESRCILRHRRRLPAATPAPRQRRQSELMEPGANSR